MDIDHLLGAVDIQHDVSLCNFGDGAGHLVAVDGPDADCLALGVDLVEKKVLKEAGYINADIHLYPNGQYDYYGVFDITFPGHQFLETIRENRVWNKTKGILGKVGSSSFSLISQIATSLLTDIAGTYLKI